jgi:hypothetical protein
MNQFNYQTIGTKTGRLWDGTICQKEFNINFTRDENYPNIPYFKTLDSLRNHIVKDGYFQDCEITEQLLICELNYGNRSIKHLINII